MALAIARAIAPVMADPIGRRGSHSTPLLLTHLCMHRHLGDAAIGAQPELARQTMHALRGGDL